MITDKLSIQSAVEKPFPVEHRRQHRQQAGHGKNPANEPRGKHHGNSPLFARESQRERTLSVLVFHDIHTHRVLRKKFFHTFRPFNQAYGT